MRFVKGHPRLPNAGRKKGTPNKAKLFRVEAFFASKSIDPLEELLKLMPTLKGEIQAKVWLDVISYYNVKPKADDGSQSSTPDILRLLAHLPPELALPLAKAVNELAQAGDDE